MKQIDSDALGILTKALGLSGAGAPITELFDGDVYQTLDIGPLVRRGRTQAGVQGFYYALIRNVHTDAETISTNSTPYVFNPAGVRAPWPSPIPEQFDLWIISAATRIVSGGGTLTASVQMRIPQVNQAFGIDDSGVAVVGTAYTALAYWDALVTQPNTFSLTPGGDATVKIGVRLPPGSEVRFSSTSSLTSTWDCILVLGLFPVALGQDILV